MSWVVKSANNAKGMKDHYKMGGIDIFVKDKLTNDIDLDFVFQWIKKHIPFHFFRGVDIIYVGQFDVFDEKKVNAIYKDGAIYVSNNQDNERDMMDDIVHEIAHSVEEVYKETIYGDGSLIREFLGKRKRLYYILKSYDLDPNTEIQTNINYSQEIDEYFYQVVGYQKMWNLINGLFLSPYSSNSIREYFALGFEEYYMGQKSDLKKLCPTLYTKLDQINDLEG